MRVLNSIFDAVIKVGFVLAGVIIAGIMVLVFSDVILRYAFDRTIPGVVELTEYSLIWITMLGAAWVLKHDGHVRVDVLLNQLRSNIRELIKGILSVISCIAIIPILLYSVITVWNYFRTDAYMYSVLELPKGIIFLILPVGTLLLVIQLLRSSYNQISRRKM